VGKPVTIDRFNFQRSCAHKYTGLVLNVGCNTDPGHIKGAAPNVINCDAYEEDQFTREKLPVDAVFDCTEDRWPFENSSVDLVILGDIVEHMYPQEFERCLAECARVAIHLCITLPVDTRIEDDPNYKDKIADVPKGMVHVHVYREPELRSFLSNAGFEITSFQAVDYGFVAEGYYIEAKNLSPISSSSPLQKIDV
jgi:hypothetical protein